MPYLIVSAVMFFVAYPMIGTTAAIWILSGAQFALLLKEIRRGQVTGAGGFIFMSLLFFGVRPIYLVLENDKWLLQKYHLQVDLAEIGSSMWWAAVALWCFALGAHFVPLMVGAQLKQRWSRNNLSVVRPNVSTGMIAFLVGAQLFTLPIMTALAKYGRSLYESAAGAYTYDLPVPLQALHIFAVVVLLERWIRRRDAANTILLVFSGVLFLYFTWLMREVSMFRGFYITGVMIVGLAVIQRLRGRARYVWLIVPIIVLQPFFQYLGGDRNKANEELAETDYVEVVFGKQSVSDAYWKFYDSGGDMNIFDTFIAAKLAHPQWYPYAWSWFYVPLHLVPRAWWPGKPKRGVTIDISCTRGYPTSPGIAGFFLLDGGLLWMLLSMVVLGFLVSYLDWRVLTMRPSYLQLCLIGIVTVNAMFLSRVFLWQYFYQLLYAAIPCIVLARLVAKNTPRSQVTARKGSRAIHQAPAAQKSA
jgi:hypothetical protein